MDGGTTFHFVTDGFDAAYSAACEAAGDDGVDVFGFEPAEVLHSPLATHIRYRRVRQLHVPAG